MNLKNPFAHAVMHLKHLMEDINKLLIAFKWNAAAWRLQFATIFQSFKSDH